VTGLASGLPSHGRDGHARKSVDLISDLKRAGFTDRGGKGKSPNFIHPKVAKPLTLAGVPGRRQAVQERAGETRDQGISIMKDSNRYVKVIEWSDEDGCYVRQRARAAPGRVPRGRERQVFAELCQIVEETIRSLPPGRAASSPPTTGRDLANKVQTAAPVVVSADDSSLAQGRAVAQIGSYPGTLKPRRPPVRLLQKFANSASDATTTSGGRRSGRGRPERCRRSAPGRCDTRAARRRDVRLHRVAIIAVLVGSKAHLFAGGSHHDGAGLADAESPNARGRLEHGHHRATPGPQPIRRRAVRVEIWWPPAWRRAPPSAPPLRPVPD